jgi:hypothetical protein
MRPSRILLILPLAAALTLVSHVAGAQERESAEEWVAHCQRWNGHNGDHENFCEQRETRIAAPSRLAVDGRENGGVSVRAWDGSDVLVVQRIQAWAPSREQARSVASDIRVHTAGGEIYADGPDSGRRQGYSVSYEIFVPRRMDLRLTTNNGPVAVNGVTGRMEISAHNGPLALRELGGDVHARATNGPLSVVLGGSRWNGEGLDAATTNGPVTLTIPGPLSAAVHHRARRWRRAGPCGDHQRACRGAAAVEPQRPFHAENTETQRARGSPLRLRVFRVRS